MNLEQELKTTVVKYRNLARRNYYVAFLLYLTAVLSSIASTFFALISNLSGPLLASLTAIPGAALFILATFKFTDRAHWYFDKKNKINALLRSVAFNTDKIDPQKIVQEWNLIDSEMEKSWPSFGSIETKTLEK